MRLARKPLWYTRPRHVPVLRYGRHYPYKGKLTCLGASGKRVPAATGTRVKVYYRVWNMSFKRHHGPVKFYLLRKIKVRKKGRLKVSLGFRSGRTILFRYHGPGGELAKAKLRLAVPPRSRSPPGGRDERGGGKHADPRRRADPGGRRAHRHPRLSPPSRARRRSPVPGGSVPSTLSLSLGEPSPFSASAPPAAATLYISVIRAEVTATDAPVRLSLVDGEATHGPRLGHLAAGSSVLSPALRAQAERRGLPLARRGAPSELKSWGQPVAATTTKIRLRQDAPDARVLRNHHKLLLVTLTAGGP